jgi:hypothetical protein
VQEVDGSSSTGAASTAGGVASVGVAASLLVGAAAGAVAEVTPAGMVIENDDTVL